MKCFGRPRVEIISEERQRIERFKKSSTPWVIPYHSHDDPPAIRPSPKVNDESLPNNELRDFEPLLIKYISNEIMDRKTDVHWDDIAGLDHAKKDLTETVIWPLLRPDLFKGCRSPGRILLLFGPPGTGKTMIGKAIAGEAKATFFYVPACSITSRWIGEGRALVKTLFGVARYHQPAVIFVDEIDSLLSQRSEYKSSWQFKAQFLAEMKGLDSGSEQILLIGATNRPQELDEAVRKRFTKRVYIPLPSPEARAWIIRTEGYSDMENLLKAASMGPLTEACRQGTKITEIQNGDIRPITLQGFESAMHEVKPSISLTELDMYEKWNQQFGSLSL